MEHALFLKLCLKALLLADNDVITVNNDVSVEVTIAHETVLCTLFYLRTSQSDMRNNFYSEDIT